MNYDISLWNDIVITDPLMAAIQELDLLFNTVNTELIGEPKFGTDWYQWLWELVPSTNELKKYVEERINENCPRVKALNHTVSVGIVDNDDPDLSYAVMVSVTAPNSAGISQTKSKTFILAK